MAVPVAILAGLLTLIPLGWLAFRALGDGGWSALASIPLIADSHEKVFADFLELKEESLKRSVPDEIDQRYVDEAKAWLAETEQQAKALLIRAVRLGPATAEQKQEFTERLESLTERYRQPILDRAKTISEAEQKLLNTILPQDQLRERQLYTLSLTGYLREGIDEIPDSDAEREQIYVDELRLVRESLRVMADVSSSRDLPAAIEQLESITDRTLELAVARSKMGMAMDLIDRRYVRQDEVSKVVLMALRKRIETDIETNESFDQAYEHFKLARRLIGRAAGGVSEPDLRKQLAEARGEEQTSSQPEASPAPAAVTHEPAPEPAPKSTSAPAQTSSAQTNSANSGAKPDAGAEPEATPDPAAAQDTATNRRGFGRRGYFGPSTRRSPRYTRDSASRPAAPAAASAPKSRSRGPNAPTDFSAMRARFEGPGSAKVVFRTTEDARQQCQRLMKRFDSRDYLIHSSNGQTTLMMKFDGPLQQLEQAIDFGTVTQRDESKRILKVQLR